MTEVAFHFNVQDANQYLCRFVRKALGQGRRLVIHAAPEVLKAVDTQLWTLTATSFYPHAMQGATSHAIWERAPVVLARKLEALPHADVLLHLGWEVPEGFQQFAQVVEVVSNDPEFRQAARQRWKHYKNLGLNIAQHDLARTGAA